MMPANVLYKFTNVTYRMPSCIFCLGLLEERLPFYGLWFPSWFYKLYPHIERNIKRNKNILSSTFDAYETMKDVLDANYNGTQRKISSRGQSQLYPLPKNRTCKAAGIPDHYCTCIKQKVLDKNNKDVVESAARLIMYLNEKLENLTEYCSEIKLTSIIYATKIDFDDKVKNAIKNYEGAKEYESKGKSAKKNDNVNKIRIGIQTEPYKATFEALMQKIENNDKASWVLDGGISRTNSYAGLSTCITDKILEKYCSCINIKLDSNSTGYKNDSVS